MPHCNGRLFDGSACNNVIHECADCGTTGCFGDGCDSQLATSATCEVCGSTLSVAQRVLAHA